MKRRNLLAAGAALAFTPRELLSAPLRTGLPLSAPIHVASVGLRARAADPLAAWYRRILGLRETGRDGQTIHLGTATRRLLSIREDTRLALAPPGEAGLYHTAFLMPARADLARWVRRAAAERFEVDGAADHLVSEAIYLTDPEGNGVEIYADRPAASWDWSGGQVQKGTEQLDFGGLLASAPDDGAYARAPEGLAIGHVHMKVGDATRAARWWQDVVGLDSVRARPGAVFLSSAGYHHHIAVNEWQTRGAARRSPQLTGLDFVTLSAAAGFAPKVLVDDWGSEIRLGVA
ncbi:VOC family protein [Frigidibacter sp. MR17.14]|uniref:VOC family protein n=1 Tax=Frigidibacter sp. MR17.14 TaxID=3126509 RepID=UPI003012E846